MRANGSHPPAIFTPVPHSGPAPHPGPPPARPARRPSLRRWAAAAALGLAVIGAAVTAREFWPTSGPSSRPAPTAAPGFATGTRSDLATALQGAFDAVLPEAGMSVRSALPPPIPGEPLLVIASSPAGETRVYEVAMTRSSSGWSITARRRPRPFPPAYSLAPTAIVQPEIFPEGTIPG